MTELAGQLKAAKVSAEAARKELTEYKDKASRILQVSCIFVAIKKSFYC